MAPWNGPRHRSWASDTNLSFLFAGVTIATYVIWELFGEAPQGMVTLVGLAGGALFGAVAGDKRKREVETERKAEHAERVAVQAERKADEAVAGVADCATRADAAEVRESGWSQHRDHGEKDGA